MSQRLHDLKIRDIEEKAGSKGFNCTRNYPIDIDGSTKKIDLACFQGEKAIAIEVETDVRSLQSNVSRAKLNRFTSTIRNSTGCLFNLVSGDCENG